MVLNKTENSAKVLKESSLPMIGSTSKLKTLKLKEEAKVSSGIIHLLQDESPTGSVSVTSAFGDLKVRLSKANVPKALNLPKLTPTSSRNKSIEP